MKSVVVQTWRGVFNMAILRRKSNEKRKENENERGNEINDFENLRIYYEFSLNLRSNSHLPTLPLILLRI